MFMTFHNVNGYRPAAVDVAHVYPSVAKTPVELDEAGLFYRADVDSSAQQAALEAGTGTVQDYQYWVDTGWKQKHGTPEAAARFETKIFEEFGEFNQAVHEHLGAPSPNTRDQVVGEAGDLLWCSTALASLTSAVLDKELKDLLYSYNHGIAYFGTEPPQPPIWQPEAGRLAIQRTPLSLTDMDSLIGVGFEPLIATAMNIEAEDDDGGIEEHLTHIVWTSAAIASQTRTLFEVDEDRPVIVLPEGLRKIGEEVGSLTAQMYLELAFIVQRLAGGSINEVVQHNVRKLSGRIDSGTVDKSDGPRS